MEQEFSITYQEFKLQLLQLLSRLENLIQDDLEGHCVKLMDGECLVSYFTPTPPFIYTADFPKPKTYYAKLITGVYAANPAEHPLQKDNRPKKGQNNG